MASFFFQNNPISKQIQKQEAVANLILDGLKTDLGMTDQHLHQGRAVLKAIGADTRADMVHHGTRDYEQLKGELYRIESVDQQGDRRMTSAFRRNGPQLEWVVIVEEKVSDRSWVHVEDRGLR